MTTKHLLLLPGLLGKYDTWDYLSEEVTTLYQAHYLEFPDYGDASKKGYTLEDFVQSVVAYIDHNSLNNITIVGHSIGGAVAMQVAYERKKEISQLVIVSSAGLPFVIKGLEGLSIRGSGIQSFHKLVESIFYDTSIKEKLSVERAYNDFAANNKRRLKGFLKTVRNVKNLDLTSTLKQIKTPSSIIWGEEDNVTPLHLAKQMVTCLENAELIVFEECGHAPQLEKPNEFNQFLVSL